MVDTAGMGYEFDWDSEIENDGPEFTLLPEGDYDFEVVGFERGRHTGSAKLPPCNKAVVHIRVENDKAAATLKHNLFLHTSVEGLLCAFFTGIGQRKHGEKLRMNWSAVVGSTGRCKIGVRKWRGDDGEERSSNEIKKFYEPTEGQPTFKPGRF